MKNLKHLYLAIFISTTLGACAQIYWEKPGVSDQEYARDVYECEKDRRQSYFNENEAGFGEQRFEELCMRSKGYTKIVR